MSFYTGSEKEARGQRSQRTDSRDWGDAKARAATSMMETGRLKLDVSFSTKGEMMEGNMLHVQFKCIIRGVA